jgi:tetratricopeptide (TPR) repeat protein
LVEQARELSNLDCVKALSIFEKAFDLVSDYPGLSKNLATVKQDVAQHNSYISAIKKALKSKKPEKATDLLDKFLEIFPEDENVRKFKVSIVNLNKVLKKKKERKINLLIIIAVVGAVLAAMGSYFAFEMFMIKKAGQQWEEVNRLLAAQKFTETQAACWDINRNLDRVRFFFMTDKQDLQGKVDDVLRSELVVKGAEGMVLFDGDYIPKDQLESSKDIKRNIEEARALVVAGNYAEAIRKFEAALATTAGIKAKTSAQVIKDIKMSITSCRLNIISDLAAKARALMTTGSYNAAIVRIDEAIAMVVEHSIDDNEPVVVKAFEIGKEVRLAKLKKLLAIGNKLFVDDSYDNAIIAYNRAQAFADANKLGGKSLNRQIYGMISKSKFGGLVSSGDKYLAYGKWREAVQAYEGGIALALKDSLQDLSAFRRAKINVVKARKMYVLASLGRQNKLARQYLKANKRRKSRDVFKQAIKTGEGGEWRSDRDVAAVIVELKRGLAELEEKIFTDTKKQFLLDRYASILKKDFGLGADAGLLDPVVVLLTATPKILKFNLTAMSYAKKGSQGKYSRYKATYSFDRERGTWRLLNKSSDSKVTRDKEYN